ITLPNTSSLSESKSDQQLINELFENPEKILSAEQLNDVITKELISVNHIPDEYALPYTSDERLFNYQWRDIENNKILKFDVLSIKFHSTRLPPLDHICNKIIQSKLAILGMTRERELR